MTLCDKVECPAFGKFERCSKPYFMFCVDYKPKRIEQFQRNPRIYRFHERLQRADKNCAYLKLVKGET